MKAKLSQTFTDWNPSVPGEYVKSVGLELDGGIYPIRLRIEEDFNGIRIYSSTHTIIIEPEAGNVVRVKGGTRL